MTVIRLRDGRLFLHSPVALDAATLAGLQSLGEIACIVCPNRLHHLFVGDYFKVFPKAKIYAAPGLQNKRRDLKFYGELGAVPAPEWRGEIEQEALAELPITREVEFFHPATRSLLLTDICFNIGPTTDLWTKAFFYLLRSYRRFGPTPDLRYIVRRSVVLKARLRKISDWDFDRIILAHGYIVETGGKAAWKQAWKGVLDRANELP